MSSARSVAIALTIAACSDKSDPPAPAPPPPADASAIDASSGTADPNAHVDDDPTHTTARPQQKRPGRQIEILLRSTPPKAHAFVDGLEVGVTPTYWVGETGAEHEFTFQLPKHALARYKFFPITTGTLHARLDPVANDVDAGVPPAGLVQPPPIPPPETLVTPAPVAPDAALVVPPTAVVPDAASAVDASSSMGPTP
jgi:hypothetical protein